jgi:putative transposase
LAINNRKAVADGLRKIYQSVTLTEAEQELDAFAAHWDSQYPCINRSWRSHWANLIAFFDYPDEIRKIIYTTNAIESINSVIREALNKSFDRLRTNGKWLIPFVVSLSNHERN